MALDQDNLFRTVPSTSAAVRVIAASLLAIAMLPVSARAQSSGISLQGPAEGNASTLPRDAFNRPCLDVEAAARSQVVNPAMMDHVVSIKNNCPKLIKVKVCYSNSDHCNKVELQAYKRVDTVLGSMQGVRFFKYKII